MLDKLNRYCLWELLRYFGLRDLISIGGVCTSWRDLSLHAWRDRFKKGVNFQKILSSNHGLRRAEHLVAAVLQRCGPTVTDLTIHLKDVPYERDILATMSSHIGPELRLLTLAHVRLSDAGVAELASRCTSLVRLSLCSVDGEFEDELASLLHVNANLVGLELKRANTISGRCLGRLAGERFQSLTIVECNRFDPRTLRALADRLKSLELTSFCGSPHFRQVHALTQLTTLKLLTFNCRIVNGDFLDGLARRCRLLESLSLGVRPRCDGVDEGLCDGILDLPRLERLALVNGNQNGESRVWARRRRPIANLKSLTLQNWKLSGADVARVMELAPALRHLALFTCEISGRDELVQLLTGLVRLRNNRSGLNLVVKNFEKVIVEAEIK